MLTMVVSTTGDMAPERVLELTSFGGGGGGGLTADAGGAHGAAGSGTLGRGGSATALGSTLKRVEELRYILTTAEADFTITHHPVAD